MSLLSQFLIPDLANLVSEYCWAADDKNADIYKTCLYGNYEGMLNYAFCDEDDEDDAIMADNKYDKRAVSPDELIRTAGDRGILIGSAALSVITNGFCGTEFGRDALSRNIPIYNTAIGRNALIPKNAFTGSCQGGYVKMVKFIMGINKLTGEINLNDGLYCACIEKHEDMAKLLAEKGAIWCSCSGADCLYVKYNTEKRT